MAVGRGGTFGEAFGALLAAGGRSGARRSTYQATGWRAQFSRLTATEAGYDALRSAGLSATLRTQRGWLSGDTTPTRANQALIAQAYRFMAGGGIPDSIRSATFEIFGEAGLGDDVRDRGRGCAPLRVDGSMASEEDWDAVEAEWNGAADPEELEALFIEHVLIPDLGEGSDPWHFPGDRYRITT